MLTRSPVIARAVCAARDDVRHAARTLRRSPGFVAVVVSTLALGLGSSAASFSVVDGLLIRPLPYPDGDRLVVVWETMPGNARRDAAPANFLDWRREGNSFASLGAWFTSRATLGVGDAPARVRASSVSGNLLAMLGGRAELGRLFLPAEDTSVAERRAILSDALWRSRFGARPSIVGEDVDIDGVRHLVVGVMAPGFVFPERADLWTLGDRGVPRLSGAPGDLTTQRDVHYFTALGRLRAGVSIPAAQRELDALAGVLSSRFPETNRNLGVHVEPLRDVLAGAARAPALVLAGVVTLVLLVACGNVANLLLARAAGREHEFALRSAIGATRRRLLSQLAAESALLGAAGGLLGLAVAWGALRVLGTRAPVELPATVRFTIDHRVIVIAIGLAVLTSLLFGAAPALRLSQGRLATLLRGTRHTESARRRRARRWLVSGELALAVALSIGGALLLKSVVRLLSVDPGFRAEGAVTMEVALDRGSYALPAAREGYHTALVERATVLPGVRAAGVVSNLPQSGGSMNRGFLVEGEPVPPSAEQQTLDYQVASPGYFSAMGIPLRAGRAIEPTDQAASLPIVVVNEAAVRRYFGGVDPVGRRLAFGGGGSTVRWRTVVGVVGDVRHAGLDREPQAEAYVPLPQDPPGSAFLVVRGANEEALAAALPRVARAIDATQLALPAQPMRERIAESTARPRWMLAIVLGFAGVALLLAALGVYAVVAASVSARANEIGIRLALGADDGRVVRLVMRESIPAIATGIATGTLASAAGTPALESLLFGVSPHDRAAFVAASGLLFAVALLATWWPARRAAAVEPLSALREG